MQRESAPLAPKALDPVRLQSVHSATTMVRYRPREKREQSRLRWLDPGAYPDAASVREFFTGDLSEAQSLLSVVDAVLRAHDVAPEAGGLGPDTLAAARSGARWLLADVAGMLRSDAARLGGESHDESERARIAGALAQAVGFVETGDDRLRRFFVGMTERL